MAQMTLAEAVFQLLRKREEHMLETLACGVKDWDAYQRVLGNLDSLGWVKQELKGLLDKQEQDDD